MSDLSILLLSKYGRLGASSRVRSYQYLPYLESRGINITVEPLLGNDYIKRLYNNRKNRIRVFRSYLRRIHRLVLASKFDVIWVEKEFFPWLPAIAPYLVRYLDASYLVDFDDAIFHQYDRHDRSIVRRLLGTKIDAVMAQANVVTVGNDYLANRARKAGAKRVEYLPTVVDTNRYSTRTHNDEKPFNIGWIGSPSTAKYLHVIQPALSELLTGSSRLVLVGSGEVDLGNTSTEVREWSEETEVSELLTFDVGIMPLPDNPWERGKCGYKLIQYMACGLPVVASPVGVNERIVDDGYNGFLAESSHEWVESINRLKQDCSLREEMGARGRRKVEEHFSLDVTQPKMHEIIRSLV